LKPTKKLKSRRRGSLSKAFDGMDQHNAWILKRNTNPFKLKLEDFKLKVKPSGGQKRLSLAIILINRPDLILMSPTIT
jgi:ATP-binding cassette subfamily F protein uup